MVTLYLFSINEYLTGDAKNIMCLLYSIMTFIKQHSLGNNSAADILQISEFSFVAW